MIIPKTIAMYLPQFHQIPENDEWWGEGFTEWTNVKNSKPLFEGHIQPRIPYEKNYYDLSDSETLINQMKIADEYGLYGFCFYHYWFKGGKKLLEKPIEKILEKDKLPLNFCLCWANEPWTRNWDGASGSKVMLMEQEYGGEKEWDEHFEYLMQFFRRDEYIKIDGRPVFVVYKSEDIPQFKQMILRWNETAKREGIKKIFIINVHRLEVHNEYPLYGDAVMDFEPFATISAMGDEERSSVCYLKQGFNNERYSVFDYKKLCDRSSSLYRMKNINHYLGCFPGWDNTPRVGAKTGVVKIIDNTVENFQEYFKKQYERSIDCNNDFIFINAWNEWGEGAFIEPDQLNGYGYLTAIKEVIDNYKG